MRHPSPSYKKYYIKSDSIYLTYGPSEPFEQYMDYDSLIYPDLRTDSAKLKWVAIRQPLGIIPSVNFPAKVLFLYHGNVYATKVSHHYRYRYSKLKISN